MFIAQEHRGKRLIRHLLEAVHKAAADSNALELRLYVHKDNSPAISAYLKNGFALSDYQIMTTKIADPRSA